MQHFKQNQQCKYDSINYWKALNTAKYVKIHKNCSYLHKNAKFEAISIFYFYKKKSNSMR